MQRTRRWRSGFKSGTSGAGSLIWSVLRHPYDGALPQIQRSAALGCATGGGPDVRHLRQAGRQPNAVTSVLAPARLGIDSCQHWFPRPQRHLFWVRSPVQSTPLVLGSTPPAWDPTPLCREWFGVGRFRNHRSRFTEWRPGGAVWHFGSWWRAAIGELIVSCHFDICRFYAYSLVCW